MEMCHWSSQWKLFQGAWMALQGETTAHTPPTHTLRENRAPTWPCSLWETGNMVMRGMNSESLGRLSSRVCVCWCEHVCTCPAALLATAAITEQHQAAEHDTHQLDPHTPPLRYEACANETRRKGGRREESKRQWGTEVSQPRRQRRGEIHPRGRMEQISAPYEWHRQSHQHRRGGQHTLQENAHVIVRTHISLTSVLDWVYACTWDKWCVFVRVCRWAAPREKNFHHVSYCHGDHQRSHKYYSDLFR